MQTSRRKFIKSGTATAVAIAANPRISMNAAEARKIPIGFQLYTVRGEFSRNVPGTLKKLAQIGYQAVEFWGYGGKAEVYQHYKAAELRKFLDDSGLKCCGIHLELAALSDENVKQTAETNHTLGSSYLNVAMAKENMKTEKGIAELADLLNKRAAELKPQNLTVGYHAHGFDFDKIAGHFAWELLFSRTEPTVNMQMDVGNCLGGGGDPIAMLKKFPHRTWTIHIKEYKEKTFASPYYKEVFELCENTCDTKWYIVEMGGLLGNGFDTPQEALNKLRQIGK